ncbi:BREX-1 system adenine-specific DNA-methyltransferase PglX [Pseudoalteromonas agarivorans]|uniref:site-specific DNA-methyltransferase (adenine-specific) n=1 Tax=Pseudoalteromonas agarivorans TaxID=176102 RepID=A0AAD0TZP9_9GAMM|nr:BREX-1 system adenine-specific DNA-methyltransferase PglX [Pseudoalteromonas agarivorans]AYM87023.1 BREX-1 system adenine-specific DNA-methyltransferase PglX [Pseudoalteromonas agarivorans]
MNTKSLKAYAPKARKQFIEAIKKRAAHFGIYEDRIAEVRIEGGAAIIEGRAFTRKEAQQRKRLESKLAESGYEMFTREIAYTWFNRLAALRYMEIHDYFDHGFRVLSHPNNQGSLPEILNHASDVAESLNLDKDHIIELQLAGDKEEELYRELLLGQCHQLAKIMPQIFKGLAFETIDDATELLLPNNLTKTDSILKGLINDIPEEDWQEIEVIGWLYQFYISEHKDSVIGKVVKSEDIPAATQLFTPNWIVKYLVQNSVGKQWLATYPDSELKGKMEYYIEPAEQSEEVIEQLKAITPTSIDPEEIKVLDPACGSGHILVEVYEVLREIYLERGYRLREIPELILTKNIYGLDIDDRAAQLAGFALMMKAREDDRRIFQRVEDGEVSLNVFSLQSTEHLDIPKLWNALDLEGIQQTGDTVGLFENTEEFVQPTGIYKEYFALLQTLKSVFLQAKTLGSLVQVDSKLLDPLTSLKALVLEKKLGTDPSAREAASLLLPIVLQSINLSYRYDVVIANPPYMGSNYFNYELKQFVNLQYPQAKQNLYSSFISACILKTRSNGIATLVTMAGWLYLYTFKALRKQLLEDYEIDSIRVLGNDAFGNSVGSIVNAATCNIVNRNSISSNTCVFNLQGGLQAVFSKPQALALPDFILPINVDTKHVTTITEETKLSEYAEVCQGLSTANDEKYVRYWYEVSTNNFSMFGGKKWFPFNKGGECRKWYGNNLFVVNWEHSGNALHRDEKAYVRNSDQYLKEGITWGRVSGGTPSFRYYPEGFVFSDIGCSVLPHSNFKLILAILNSSPSKRVFDFMSENYKIEAGHVKSMPIKNAQIDTNVVDELIELYKADWDANVISWDFSALKLENSAQDFINKSIENSQQLYEIAKSLEFSLNNEVSDSYGWENDAKDFSSLPTFSHFREKYGTLQITDLTKSLFEYSVGCILGRYSLDRTGIVYANMGNEGFKELEALGTYKTFPADDDGIIPLASEEWLFDDDATTRFKEFVKTVWGDEHLSENLEFVAESLCLHALKPLSTKKGDSESAMDTIRRYFSTQFFKDHCKTYKKRPIYWLFSSGKEKAFECLVYLHRYNEGTLSRMRTEYVTPLMGKYDAQHTLLSEQQLQATGTEARRIEKELKSLEKKQAELRTFDEQLKHYAEKRITLDLDDGVKANYGKFGNLLADVKAIHGKAVK